MDAPTSILTPPEDDLPIPALFTRPRRRRSSMLDRWIKDQQTQPTSTSTSSSISDITIDPSSPTSGTPSNAYLAYPDLVSNKRPSTVSDDGNTTSSYDLVQDDDLPSNDVDGAESAAKMPTTPKSQKYLPSPSSFRGFHFPFRSASPADTISRASTATPRSPSRISLFPRSSDRHTYNQHSRSASLSTLGLPTQSPTREYAGPTMGKWRPTVLGHFGMASPPANPDSHSDTSGTPSRPSISSYTTYASTAATTIESDFNPPASKVSLVDSIRSRGRSSYKPSYGATSSLSLASPPASIAQSPRKDASSTIRLPFGLKSKPNHAVDDATLEASRSKTGVTRPTVAYASANQPRVSFASLSSRNSKKKKLVVSGVGPNETRRFEGVKRWCESFGEVSQITRMPNGDLHVHFKDAEVADTVCRLRAKVFIAGVGSVNLSWYTGNKR
ncbi:hypothetical protein HGRIS_008179 [Hohenbuehelia grisea]|uniref:RRM Nup35-type domain-containing protein n=1 Tax=Hohenbuehelia grisea TaxID=104357 RepID=A0ABR3J783_9AGAR